MSTDLGGGEISNWIVTLGASAVTAVGGFLLALVNRGPAMQSALDARLQTLIDGYERRVDDLMLEVHCLREEVVNLRRRISRTGSALSAYSQKVCAVFGQEYAPNQRTGSYSANANSPNMI